MLPMTVEAWEAEQHCKQCRNKPDEGDCAITRVMTSFLIELVPFGIQFELAGDDDDPGCRMFARKPAMANHCGDCKGPLPLVGCVKEEP